MYVLHDYYSSRTSFVGMEDEAIAMYWTPCEDAEMQRSSDVWIGRIGRTWGHGVMVSDGLGRLRTRHTHVPFRVDHFPCLSKGGKDALEVCDRLSGVLRDPSASVVLDEEAWAALGGGVRGRWSYCSARRRLLPVYSFGRTRSGRRPLSCVIIERARVLCRPCWRC